MKKILAILLMILVIAAMTGCGDKEDPAGPTVDPDPVKVTKAATFKLDKKTEAKGEGTVEKGVLYGLAEDGTQLFALETGEYDVSELDKIQGAGLVGDKYYLICGGDIWCIGTVGDDCGKILWKNGDFKGASAVFANDDNGNFFAAGYYEPAYFAVDKDGKTVVSCAETLIDQPEGTFFYPTEMKYSGGLVHITYETNGATLDVDPLTGKVVSVEYPKVDTSKAVGTWNAVLCEIEGMEWTPDSKQSITITINADMTMDFVYKAKSKSNSKTFTAVPTEVEYGKMYYSLDSDENWYLDAVKDKKNEITFALSGDNKAEAFWYQGEQTADAYPAVLWIKLERQ